MLRLDSSETGMDVIADIPVNGSIFSGLGAQTVASPTVLQHISLNSGVSNIHSSALLVAIVE